MDKREACYNHTERRLLRRYNITLYEHELQKLISMVRHGDAGAIFLKRVSNSRSIWRLPISQEIKDHNPCCRAETMVVVYDKKRQVFVMALPTYFYSDLTRLKLAVA